MIGICGRGITFSVCSLLGVLGSSDKSHLNRLYCLQINIQCFCLSDLDFYDLFIVSLLSFLLSFLFAFLLFLFLTYMDL